MRILGLDLGTNSVGWAVVDKEQKKILDTGVRIFPEGLEVDTIGKGEKERSKNATRREKRQSRRHFYRKRMRKIKLLELLIKEDMCPLSIPELRKWKNWDKSKKSEGRVFPTSPEFTDWIRMNPYDLRKRALEEKLSFYEIGRIFYHLIQRRGFLSNRKSKEDTSIFTKGKPDENILSINETRKKIQNITLGKYLSTIPLKEGETYKKVTDESGKGIRIRGRYTVRDMYVVEFEKIWQKQCEFYNLAERYVTSSKIRELRGTSRSNRIIKRIEYLKSKYGKDNVIVEQSSNKGFLKVITYSNIRLKELLGGNITMEKRNGQDFVRFNSNESILFWQRPLRSQKRTLSNCRFEDKLPVITSNGNFLKNENGEIQTRSKKPCPISHPDFELFRAYQFINNIRYGKNIKLTDNQRKAVLDLMNKNDSNFLFKKVPKELKMTYEKFNYSDDQKVPGNTTIKRIESLFEKEIWETYYDSIWHCFYFFDDDQKLYEKLSNDFAYQYDLEKIKKIRLKEGYSSVSLKAIRNILPFLKKGYTYDRAVILGGIKNAFGKRWEYFSNAHGELERDIIDILNKETKEGEAMDHIKDYLASPINDLGFRENDPHFNHLYHHSFNLEKAKGQSDLLPEVENLKNPIVQQGLNEARRLINTLLVKYRKQYDPSFRFDRINIEMGRNLRNNKSMRQQISYRISQNEEKNNEARARLAEYGLQPSRENIQKYLMYKEIEDHISGPVQCPYTGRIIKISDVLSRDNLIQIEHIIPFSISLDDSFGNKTLCEANFNREKGEKTPYQFYLENPDPSLWGINRYQKQEDGWAEISDRAFRLLPYFKARKFTSKKSFEKTDFIERQLNDSRYIAKKAVELLSHICKDVRVMPGQLTSELRHLWGLNNVMQPVINLDLKNIDLDNNGSIPCYLVMDEKDNVISFIPKQNIKPITQENELLLVGYVEKKRFSSRFLKRTIDVSDLEEGKYWAKLNIDTSIKIMPRYIEKPASNENYLTFKGRVKRGIFNHDSLGRIETDRKDGRYWVKLRITNKDFEQPKKDFQPQKGKNRVILFGRVESQEFKSYVYKCKTDLPDGKYWIILYYDPGDIEFVQAENPMPDTTENQIILNGTVGEDNIFVSDVDKEFKIRIAERPGKYYAVFELDHQDPELRKVDNDPPSVKRQEKMLEGNIWVDKYTGEIRFDPKKNRDDHRHHAIDAITIALTEQSFLQRLSTYNAQRKAKQRHQLDSTEKFPDPWIGFNDDVKKAIECICVSHKKNNRILTKNKNGISVRGQLHKDYVFGRRQDPMSKKSYHKRVKITELTNHKHVAKVVDETIRENIIKKHLSEKCGVDVNNPKGYTIPKDAFYKNGEWQLFLPNKKGSDNNGEPVPIKKIRWRESLGNAIRLKSTINQWVNPRNNHHVLVYYDHDGNMKEDVVQFWTVVERVFQGIEIHQLPEDGKGIITSLELNDMFLLGLSDADFERNKDDYSFLSQYLYRVQKFTSGDYYFRLHTASTLTNDKERIYIKNFSNGLTGWKTYNPIKVKVDILGKISKSNFL